MKAKILDVVGLSSAVLCLIHCIVFPLLMILPFGISHNPYVDLFFFLIGLYIVYRLNKTIDQLFLLFLFWFSVCLIGISVLADLILAVHVPSIYPGAVLLIIAHAVNFNLNKSGVKRQYMHRK